MTLCDELTEGLTTEEIYATLTDEQLIEEHEREVVTRCNFSDREQVLVALIPRTEQQRRNQSEDDHEHGSLQVYAVTDMNTVFRCMSGSERKRFEGVIDDPELAELPTLLKLRANRIQ